MEASALVLQLKDTKKASHGVCNFQHLNVTQHNFKNFYT